MSSPLYPPQPSRTPKPAAKQNAGDGRRRPPNTMALVGITIAVMASYLIFVSLLGSILAGVMQGIVDNDSLEMTTTTHGTLAGYLIGAAISIVAFYLIMSLKRPLRLYFKRVTGRGLLTAIKYFGFETLPQSIIVLLIILFGLEFGTGFSQNELLLPSERVMFFAILTIVAPIFEEMVCRGYLYAKLRQRHKFWPAASISGAIFALAHTQYYAEPINLVSIFLLSLFLARSFEKTRNLWIPIIIHALHNGSVFVLGLYL